jgi:hypothetical protein
MFQVEAKTMKSLIETTRWSSRHSLKKSWLGPSVEEEKEPVQARPAAKVRGDYIMGHVPAPVRDRSGAQLLDAPGEIHLFDHSIARPGHRRAIRNPERRDLWGNPSGPGGPSRRPIICRRISQSAEGEDPENWGIPARICHGHRTACPLRLHYTTRGPHKQRGRQSILRCAERPRYQNPAATRRREDDKRGPQTGMIASPTEGRQKITGTKSTKIDHRERSGDRQESLNGDRVTTEKRTGGGSTDG